MSRFIDLQRGLDDPGWGPRNNLQAGRQRGWPVWHVQPLSLETPSTVRPAQPGVHFKELVAPHEDEPVVQKHVNSAFIHTPSSTPTGTRLRAAGVTGLVIVGSSTDHCVSTTARKAGDLGHRALLPGARSPPLTGPHGQRPAAQSVHDVHLAGLHGECGTVRHSAAILADLRARRWSASAGGPGRAGGAGFLLGRSTP